MSTPRSKLASRPTGALVISCALLLGGCAAWLGHGEPAEGGADAGENAPSAWSARPEARAGVDAAWLRKTGGAELAALVGEALEANPDMRASAARVEKAAAEAKQAAAARLPTLGFEGSGRRSEQKFIGLPLGNFPGVPGSLDNQFGVSLNAAWEADVWGKLRASARAGEADAEAAAWTHQAARVSLAAQVAKAWLALAESREQVRLADEGLEARRLLAAAVRERFEGAANPEDGGSASQVRLTEAEAAAGEATLAQRKQEEARAVRQLELLLGRYPSGRTLAAARLPALPPPPPAGLPSELLLRRPDIRAAEASLAADGQRRLQARLARFPSVQLTGSLGTTTDSVRRLLQSDYGVWSLGGSLTQPVFDAGRLAAGETRARAIEQEAAASLQRTVLQAFGEVEQALIAEGFLRDREAAARRAAELAAEAARRAEEEFDSGTGDVLTLIETRQRQIDTASQLTALRRVSLDNRIDLHLALGGGFSL